MSPAINIHNIRNAVPRFNFKFRRLISFKIIKLNTIHHNKINSIRFNISRNNN
jgi:hypothetical protein